MWTCLDCFILYSRWEAISVDQIRVHYLCHKLEQCQKIFFILDTFSVSLYSIYQSLYLFPSDQSEHFRSLTFNFNHYSYLKISSFVWHIKSNQFKLNLILSYLILSYFLRQFCSFTMFYFTEYTSMLLNLEYAIKCDAYVGTLASHLPTVALNSSTSRHQLLANVPT